MPRWAKDPGGANKMINLRAETVREKKGWKSTLARKRCIIPIDGFYEWQDQGKGQRKQPFYITSRDFTPLALAGLWATWRDPDSGEELFTVARLAQDVLPSPDTVAAWVRRQFLSEPETEHGEHRPASVDADTMRDRLAAYVVPVQVTADLSAESLARR